MPAHINPSSTPNPRILMRVHTLSVTKSVEKIEKIMPTTMRRIPKGLGSSISHDSMAGCDG